MDLKIKHDVNDAGEKRIPKPVPSKASRSIPILGAKTKRKRKFLCNICQKKLSSPKNLETHVNKVHRIKDFICDYDGKHFNTKDKLRLHILQHRIYYRVQCGVCKKEYKTNQSMRKHLRSHFEHHQCETCGQTFKYKRLLENHVSALHQEYPTVPCKYCTRLFPNKTTRDSHQKLIHQDQQVNTAFFKCQECPKGFEMKEELRIHSFIHFNGKIHTCLDCNQIFKKKKLLFNHMQKHESPSLQCGVCKQMFKYRSNLGKHQKEGRCKVKAVDDKEFCPSAEHEAEMAKQQLIDMTVNPKKVCISQVNNYPLVWENQVKDETVEPETVIIETKPGNVFVETFEASDKAEAVIEEDKLQEKRSYCKKRSIRVVRKPYSSYVCDLCDFTAERKSQILSHVRRHISSKRHKCKRCTDFFTTRQKLHNHSLKAHGRGVIGSVEYSNTSEECSICQRVFTKGRMKYHLRLHNTPRFTCDQCPKVFRTQSTLEKHNVNNHLCEKKFTCATCGKSFKKLTVLKQHEEIHNPFKIYVRCEVCKSIMLLKSLKLHMEMKHGSKYQDKKFLCECGKAFLYSKQLDKHYEAVHEKVNRGIIYPCSDCGLVFNRRMELRNHSFDHFSGKIFECFCGMKFKNQKLLKIHSFVHKDSVSFECDICLLTFKTRGGRRKHRAKAHSQVQEEIIEIARF